jgi:hypothetical protein
LTERFHKIDPSLKRVEKRFGTREYFHDKKTADFAAIDGNSLRLKQMQKQLKNSRYGAGRNFKHFGLHIFMNINHANNSHQISLHNSFAMLVLKNLYSGGIRTLLSGSSGRYEDHCAMHEACKGFLDRIGTSNKSLFILITVT